MLFTYRLQFSGPSYTTLGNVPVALLLGPQVLRVVAYIEGGIQRAYGTVDVDHNMILL